MAKKKAAKSRTAKRKVQPKKKAAKPRAKKTASPLAIGIDRRTERRINARLPIAARVYWQQESEAHGRQEVERYYFTRDLSSSGLFLLTDHPPPLFCEIDIQLSIQFMKDPVRLRGEVVRHESQEGRAVGFGVKFLENPERLKLLMDQLHRALKSGGIQ